MFAQDLIMIRYVQLAKCFIYKTIKTGIADMWRLFRKNKTQLKHNTLTKTTRGSSYGA